MYVWYILNHRRATQQLDTMFDKKGKERKNEKSAVYRKIDQRIEWRTVFRKDRSKITRLT